MWCFLQSLHSVFFEAYDYRAFLTALGFSLVGVLIAAAVENLLLRPLLKECCPSYFGNITHDPATLPSSTPKLQLADQHGHLSDQAGNNGGHVHGNGASAYAGGVYPTAPKLSGV